MCIRDSCGGESGWDGRVPGPMGVQIGGVQRRAPGAGWIEGEAVSYTHLRAHETVLDLVCRLLLEKKKKTISLRTAERHRQVM